MFAVFDKLTAMFLSSVRMNNTKGHGGDVGCCSDDPVHLNLVLADKNTCR